MIADIVGYLDAGFNVVTISAIPMVYPHAAPPKWREPIEHAARQGNATFYATGCEPGFVSLNLPTALLAGAGKIDTYRMDEYALDLDLSYPIWEVLHESMGFGKPDGHMPIRIAVGKVNNDWEPVVRYIADALGVDVDRVALDWETILAPHDLDTALGVIAKDTICGHRWQLAAMHDDRPVVSVQYFAAVTSTPWPESWPRPAQPGQGGMVFRDRGEPEHDACPQSGPDTRRRHQPRCRRNRHGSDQRHPGGHRRSGRTRGCAVRRSLDRHPPNASLT